MCVYAVCVDFFVHVLICVSAIECRGIGLMGLP